MVFLKTAILFSLLTLSNAHADEPHLRGERCSFALGRIDESSIATTTISNQQLLAATEAFKTCLSEYVQIQTVSPKGDEHLAVSFFQAIFEGLDFPFKIYEVPDALIKNSTRFNIVATLPERKRTIVGDYSYDWSLRTETKSIILNNHMDVVSVAPEQWENPSLVFSGRIAPSLNFPNEDFIWGRGALDMKGVAIVQLVSMVLVDKLKISTSKDIHFLAISDEEEGSSGAIGTIKEMSEGKKLHSLASAAVMLGESGGMIDGSNFKNFVINDEIFKTDRSINLIGVEEKGTAWMKFKDTSYQRLLNNLYKLRVLDIKKQISEIKKYKALRKNNCMLIEAKTPDSKVNVVASKIHFKLHCFSRENIEDELKKAFTNGFKDILYNSKMTKGNMIEITVATKSSSHGSLGLNQSVLDVFASGLHRIGTIKLTKRGRKPKFYKEYSTETIDLFLDKMGELIPKLGFFNHFSWIKPLKRMILRMVGKEFGIKGLFRTNCEFTAFNYSGSEASSLVDCRLLHTVKKKRTALSFINEIYKELDNSSLVIEPIALANVTSSTTKNKEYDIIVNSIHNQNSRSLVVPYLFPAGSDLRYFRNPKLAGVLDINPIPSYGVFPVKLDLELVKTMHGSNERFPVREIGPAISSYFEILKNLSLDL